MMKRPLFHIKICQLKEKIWLKSVHKQGNWALVVQQTFKVNFNIGLGIPIKFPSQRIKKLLKLVEKQRNYALIKKCQNRHD